MGTAQGAGKESVMAGKTACPRCKSKEASPGDAFCCACGHPLRKETEFFDKLTVGRASYNDIAISDTTVSREHAWLISEGTGWILEDRHSSGGTFVNDDPTPVSRRKVRPDDVIRLGKYKARLANLLTMRKKMIAPVPIHKAETIIGRGENAHFRLDDPRISQRHARLYRKGKDIYIEDLGSLNGTFVNGRKISSPCPITSQDEVALAAFTFKIADDTILVVGEPSAGIRLDAQGIRVEVPDRKQGGMKKLLDDVSFTVKPGELVGLMGPSGCGKTTLLQACNGYLPPSSGCARLDGYRVDNHYDLFRGRMGYLPQQDILHGELTVYEALYFAASMRLPSDTSRDEIDARIRKIMAQVGLEECDREVAIDPPGRKGISGGQKKRVSLAMELLTQPDILFLDEPTSGLSTEDALLVMKVLRGLADQGTAILLCIHQPDLDLYKMMDNLIVLASGKLLYYGPAYPDSLTYFNPDQPRDEVMHNPGNVLKALTREKKRSRNHGVKDWEGALAQRYRNGDGQRYYREYVKGRELNGNIKFRGSEQVDDEPSRPFSLRQWWILTRRYFTVKCKDRMNTLMLAIQAPIIAALIAGVFRVADPDSVKVAALSGYDQAALFLLVVSALWFGISNSAREIVSEASIYQRERMVNLNITSYVLSKFTVLSLLCILQCVCLVWMVHLSLELRSDPPDLLMAVLPAAEAGLAIGLFISSRSNTEQTAVSLVPLVLIPMVILGGGMIRVADMNPPSVTFSYLVPTRWAYEHIIHVESRASAGPRIADVTEMLFGKYATHDAVIFAVMLAFIVGFVWLARQSQRAKDRV